LSAVDAALRGALIALLLLLALALWRQWRTVPAARAGLRLCLGLCVQMFGAAPAVEWHWPPVWQAPLVAVAVGNAVLFWLFVQALFDDDFRLRPRHRLAWLAAAGLGAFNAAVVAGSASPITPWSFGLQRLVAFAGALLACWAVLRNWRGDLVEPRRRLRGFIAGLGIVYTLVQVGLRMGSGTGMLTETGALIDVSMMLVLVGVVAVSVFRLSPGELFATERPVAAPPPPLPPAAAAPEEADTPLADKLLALMRTDRPHADEDLGLAALAKRLGVAEYRLRRVINRHLGHRNFNAFVNAFRLAEAKAALADPKQRDRPVLTIALEAGFQSIGPFNRAFKAETGLTPTEFRKEKLADS